MAAFAQPRPSIREAFRSTEMPVQTTFETARVRARRKRVVATLVGRGATRRLPELEDLVPRPWALTYEGRRLIPVQQIVGTVDGGRDFDRDFLPRNDLPEGRWRALEQAFEYSSFPPITVYATNGSFFVVDGHHRVAIARQWGIDSLEAEITSVRSLRPEQAP